MRWRSSLSSIMTSMASNGGFDEQGAANGGGEGGTGTGGGGVDMDVGDGKGTGPGGERKVIKNRLLFARRRFSFKKFGCSFCYICFF